MKRVVIVIGVAYLMGASKLEAMSFKEQIKDAAKAGDHHKLKELDTKIKSTVTKRGDKYALGNLLTNIEVALLALQSKEKTPYFSSKEFSVELRNKLVSTPRSPKSRTEQILRDIQKLDAQQPRITKKEYQQDQREKNQPKSDLGCESVLGIEQYKQLIKTEENAVARQQQEAILRKKLEEKMRSVEILKNTLEQPSFLRRFFNF